MNKYPKLGVGSMAQEQIDKFFNSGAEEIARGGYCTVFRASIANNPRIYAVKHIDGSKYHELAYRESIALFHLSGDMETAFSDRSVFKKRSRAAATEMEVPADAAIDEQEDRRRRRALKMIHLIPQFGGCVFNTTSNIYYVISSYFARAAPISSLSFADNVHCPTATSITYKIVRAVAALHAAGVVHNDISPSNILVSTTNEIRVIDFGLSWVKGRTKHTEAWPGTPEYYSPRKKLLWTSGGTEIDGIYDFLDDDDVIDDKLFAFYKKSDVFALGLVLFEVYAGYHERNQLYNPVAASNDVMRQLSERSGCVFDAPSDSLSENYPQLGALVRRMLGGTEDARPTMKDVRDELHVLFALADV